MNNRKLKTLILAAMFIAIGIVLPFFTGQIKQIGNMLLPMHIPIMFCGLVCGKYYGLAVGFATPLLRSLLFGMPRMYPNALAMAFELAVYGFVIGLLFSLLRKRGLLGIYISLAAAMLSGRIVWGIVQCFILGIGAGGFTYTAFMTSAFVNGIPGIILQLVLIPPVMLYLERTKTVKLYNN